MHDPVKIQKYNIMKSHTTVTLYWMVSTFIFDQVMPYLADITSILLLELQCWTFSFNRVCAHRCIHASIKKKMK